MICKFHLIRDYIYIMCKFHLYFTLLLCQIALRGYSPLEVHCTSLHYLYSAPFSSLHVGYACFRLCVFPVCRARGACRWRRAASAVRKRVLNFIITKILSQSKYLFAYRLEMFIYLAARVRCLSLFLLSYTFTGKFFLCFCLKFFGKFFLEGLGV